MITPGHFAIGLALGTAVTLPPLASAWLRGDAVSRPLGRLLLVSYAVAVWAVVPNLLHYAGAPLSLTTSAPMNLFVLHPLIDRVLHGGKIIGGAALLFAVTSHYLLLVLAVWRAKRLAGHRAGI